MIKPVYPLDYAGIAWRDPREQWSTLWNYRKGGAHVPFTYNPVRQSMPIIFGELPPFSEPVKWSLSDYEEMHERADKFIRRKSKFGSKSGGLEANLEIATALHQLAKKELMCCERIAEILSFNIGLNRFRFWHHLRVLRDKNENWSHVFINPRKSLILEEGAMEFIFACFVAKIRSGGFGFDEDNLLIIDFDSHRKPMLHEFPASRNPKWQYDEIAEMVTVTDNIWQAVCREFAA